MPTAMEHSLALMKAVGPLGALRLLVSRALGIERSLRVEVDGRALDVRPTDSDLFVVAQVFGSGEYRLPQNVVRGLTLHVSDVLGRSGKPIVVDAGSNIGCSTLFFSTLFPDARIISIEPDEDAYRIAKRHCAGVPNIDLLFGALWSDDRGVQLNRHGSGSWSNVVERGGSVPTFTLRQILELDPDYEPLLLKLDVEGAEYEICSSDLESISRFACIIVESHDFMFPGRGCLHPLYKVLSVKKYDTYLRGENIFFVDSRLCAQ